MLVTKTALGWQHLPICPLGAFYFAFSSSALVSEAPSAHAPELPDAQGWLFPMLSWHSDHEALFYRLLRNGGGRPCHARLQQTFSAFFSYKAADLQKKIQNLDKESHNIRHKFLRYLFYGSICKRDFKKLIFILIHIKN